MEIRTADVRNVLTRTSGFLKTVTSHSLQPYRGCALGSSLCGVGCYAGSSELAYRDAMVRVARRHLPGCVGVNVDGFAGRYL